MLSILKRQVFHARVGSRFTPKKETANYGMSLLAYAFLLACILHVDLVDTWTQKPQFRTQRGELRRTAEKRVRRGRIPSEKRLRFESVMCLTTCLR